MAGFFATRTAKLTSDSEPFFSSTSQRQTEAIDLWQLGFMFAISDVPPEVGTVKAYKVSWSAQSNEKALDPIRLINCDSMQPEESNNSAFEIS